MSKPMTYIERIEHLKELSGYHFEPFRKDESPFHIPGTFSGADWFSEVLAVEAFAKGGQPFGVANCSSEIRNGVKRGAKQFDYAQTQDPNYAPDHVFLNRIMSPHLTRERAPILFEMVDAFGLEPATLTVKIHIQHPGQIFPVHVDSLMKHRKDKPVFEAMKNSPDKWERFNVQLEDWVWGHVWTVGNTYWSQWRAGEIMHHPWWSMPHGTANCSHKPRYSLQITGVATEKTRELLAGQNRKIELKGPRERQPEA